MGYVPVLLALMGFSLLVLLVNVNSLKKSKQGIVSTLLSLKDVLGTDFQVQFGKDMPQPIDLNQQIQQMISKDAGQENLQVINKLVNNYKNFYLDYNTQIKGAPTRWIAPVFGYKKIA